MSEIPEDLKYTKDHEWVRQNDDGTITVGITDYAQSQLGEVVYAGPSEVGLSLEAGDECAVVESVKATSEVFSPVAGTLAAANPAVDDAPELVNQDPYGEGWLIQIETGDSLDELLDAAAYRRFVDSEING